MVELSAERLFVYPVKSCGGLECEALRLAPEMGVVGDRVMGLAIDETPASGDGVFRRKIHFLHGMRWPETVRLRPQIVFEEGAPVLRGFRIASAEGERSVAPEELIEIAQSLAPGAKAARLIASYPGERFADRPQPYASIINLDTLESFAAFVGDPAIAEPSRWRCNIYVRAGIGAEYGWVRERAELSIGGARLQTELLLGRCAMVTAEPGLGRKDHPELLQKLRAFENAQGYEHPEETAPVMGVLALPKEAALLQRAG